MLKWTNPAQKSMVQDMESFVYTPHIKNRLRKRTKICQLNKENFIPVTSTPYTKRTIINSYGSTLPKYASTLPRFEEEYSPSANIPSGQELALRGLLPDVFVGNQRYFRSPLLESPQLKSPLIKPKSNTKVKKQCETVSKESAKMTDNSLDKLIDAILDSACKTEKRKKTRRSLNLRRRTLLKTFAEEDERAQSLSPSYAAGDDPASDLTFLLVEPTKARRVSNTPTAGKVNNLPPTPLPHTPALNEAVPKELLIRMPTPVSVTPLSSGTFHLETPIRTTRKRRLLTEQKPEDCDVNTAKKLKRHKMNYLEVGLALPSIYV